MILAKARLVEDGGESVRVRLSFPTGFDPEEVVPESVRANGNIAPQVARVDPRRGGLKDLYREFEVSFPTQDLQQNLAGGSLQITGRFRRGVPFTASVPVASRVTETDH